MNQFSHTEFPLKGFRYFYHHVFLEGISPKDKISKYKIKDPFMIQFILRYGDEINWASIKDENSIKTQILYVLLADLYKRFDEDHPKTVKFSANNIKNIDKEIEVARQAHPEHYDKLSEMRKNQGDDAVRKYLADIINRDKLGILYTWKNRINENIEDPEKKYLVLKPIFDSTSSSQKKTPKPYIWKAVKKYLKAVEDSPTELKNLIKIYETALSEQLMDSDRFKRIPSENYIWIKIPGEKEDPENYNSNIETLMGLSCNIWCISGKTMATTYLAKDGGFYLLLDIVNKKPTALIAVRMKGNVIQEVRGELESQSFDPVYMEKHILELADKEKLDIYKVWEFINNERKKRDLEIKLPEGILKFRENVERQIFRMILEKIEPGVESNQLTVDFDSSNSTIEYAEEKTDSIMNLLTFSEKKPQMGIFLGDLENAGDELDDRVMQYMWRLISGEETIDQGDNDSTKLTNREGDEIMRSRYTLSKLLEIIKKEVDLQDEENADVAEAINDIVEHYSDTQPYSFLSDLKDTIDLSHLGVDEKYDMVSWAYNDGNNGGIENRMYDKLNEHLDEYFSIVDGSYLSEYSLMAPVELSDLSTLIKENSLDDVIDNFQTWCLKIFKENYTKLDVDDAYYNYTTDMYRACDAYNSY